MVTGDTVFVRQALAQMEKWTGRPADGLAPEYTRLVRARLAPRGGAPSDAAAHQCRSCCRDGAVRRVVEAGDVPRSLRLVRPSSSLDVIVLVLA